jgi:predicted nuclease of predicted toxin-antitoxin system
MKLLLDENLPHDLRHELASHDVFTAHYQGWAGLKNGPLLSRAAAAGFDALLTLDSGMPHQQNLQNLPLAIVVLRAASNDIDDLRPVVPRLLEALASLRPRTIIHVE